eukprot:358866-Chlamydomonas_euryale.AAC.2
MECRDIRVLIQSMSPFFKTLCGRHRKAELRTGLHTPVKHNKRRQSGSHVPQWVTHVTGGSHMTPSLDAAPLHMISATPTCAPGRPWTTPFPFPLLLRFPWCQIVDKTSEPMPAGGGGSGGGVGVSGGNVHSFSSLGDAAGKPMSKDAFLNKLPQTVIKNGKVINVRGSVAAVMVPGSSGGSGGGGDGDKAVVSTPADALLDTMQRKHMGPALPPGRAAVNNGSAAAAAAAFGPGGAEPGAPPPPEIATLQVKTEDGSQTLVLKLRYDDTIGALRKCIDAHRGAKAGGGGAKAYQMRTAFPARAYDDVGETLRAAGLVPNATLFLKAVKPQ